MVKKQKTNYNLKKTSDSMQKTIEKLFNFFPALFRISYNQFLFNWDAGEGQIVESQVNSYTKFTLVSVVSAMSCICQLPTIPFSLCDSPLPKTHISAQSQPDFPLFPNSLSVYIIRDLIRKRGRERGPWIPGSSRDVLHQLSSLSSF